VNVIAVSIADGDFADCFLRGLINIQNFELYALNKTRM